MGVTRIGGLERDRARPRQKHDVDDVGERHVAMVRPLVIAPAHMHARLLRRHIRQRMIQCLDMLPRSLAELLERQIGVLDMPPHREVGAIDLHRNACIRDCFVFVAHRLGDREQIRLLVRVILVAEEQRDDPGRSRAEKCSGGLHPAERRFQMCDIGLRRLGVGDRDRAGAGRCLAARPAGIAKDALRQPRKLREILIDKGVARTAKPAEAVLDIGRIARLRHLAVIDEVDAGMRLFPDDLRNRVADARLERRAVDRHAFLLGEHRADQILGPRQAAGMRRQEPLRPIRHC